MKYLAVALVLAGLAGCGKSPSAPDPATLARAREALHQYGCVNCHQVPGVVGSKTHVGPPLAHFAQRALVAGVAPNTPESLARFIRDPQEVAPGSLMPNLNVSPEDAAAMAAYLHTLK